MSFVSVPEAPIFPKYSFYQELNLGGGRGKGSPEAHTGHNCTQLPSQSNSLWKSGAPRRVSLLLNYRIPVLKIISDGFSQIASAF